MRTYVIQFGYFTERNLRQPTRLFIEWKPLDSFTGDCQRPCKKSGSEIQTSASTIVK